MKRLMALALMGCGNVPGLPQEAQKSLNESCATRCAPNGWIQSTNVIYSAVPCLCWGPPLDAAGTRPADDGGAK